MGSRDFIEGLKNKGLFVFIGFFILYILLLFLIVFITSMNGSLNLWAEKIKIYAFINAKTSDSDIVKLLTDLKSNFHFKEATYITQKDAWEKLKEVVGRENDIFAWGSPDSLPKTIEITPSLLENIDDIVRYLLNYNFVEDVRYPEEMVTQWYNLQGLVEIIKKIFIYLGSLSFLLLSVELLTHAHLAYPIFSVPSQILENIIITMVSFFSALVSICFFGNIFKDRIATILPYFSYIFDLRHILIWTFYFIISNVIISFTSALISFQRLK
jgi:cell division transport system permease protein